MRACQSLNAGVPRDFSGDWSPIIHAELEGSGAPAQSASAVKTHGSMLQSGTGQSSPQASGLSGALK